jgi:endonuclease/exonuclease/phosphatase family metal-dependent hydrolase
MVILLLNMLAIIALLIAYLSPYINPEKIWFPAFFGLALPYILLANLLFVIYWIILRKWFLILSLFTIAAGFKQHQHYLHFSRDKQTDIPATSFKLLTFNTHNLSQKESRQPDSITRQQILDFLQRESPQMLCLQEFTAVGKDHLRLFSEWSRSLHLPYFYHDDYFEERSYKTNAIVIFSVFPIINRGTLRDDQGKAYCIFTDQVVSQDDTIRIYNVHLQSVKLHRKDLEFVKDITTPGHIDQDLKEGSFAIIKKLRNAFRQRSEHVNKLKEHMNASPFPIVVCGDFNDTPTSYAYRVIRKGLKDAFSERGNGYSYTYQASLPVPIRIDYIFTGSSIQPISYFTRKIGLSDHLPVISNLFIEE